LETSKFSGDIRLIFNSNHASTKGYKHTKDYILWVANLKTDKRPELVIELAKKINDKNIDILIVGDIQEKKYSYFKDPWNIPNNMHYLGKRSPEEVNQIVNSSLFVIHTCLPEGFPGIFIQAWLHGKGVLSLSFDPGSIIETNKLGFSANNSFPLFLNAVNHWIENNTNREDVKKRAIVYSQSNFDSRRNAKLLENLIHEIRLNEKN
jgi:glycosyltransferase involved in cell wall biosynthesis